MTAGARDGAGGGFSCGGFPGIANRTVERVGWVCHRTPVLVVIQGTFLGLSVAYRATRDSCSTTIPVNVSAIASRACGSISGELAPNHGQRIRLEGADSPSDPSVTHCVVLERDDHKFDYSLVEINTPSRLKLGVSII